MKEESPLSLNLFTRVQDDLEKRKYIILGELKKISRQFQHYKIYPYLSDLIELRRTLGDVVSRLSDLRSEFPRRISKIDWINKRIEHEVIFADGTDIQAVEKLIEWVLPKIDRVIGEGTAIHEFAESELSIEQVGILPNYRDEGYFFIPDNPNRNLNLFRFEISIFQSSADNYRTLKTRFLKQLQQSRARLSPGFIKLELIREVRELPNPATYAFDTQLDFPFSETILPVAKRKLMQVLTADERS